MRTVFRVAVLAFLGCVAALAQSMAVSWPALAAVGATGSASVQALAPAQHTVQVTVTGSPTACTVRLEGSLDGVTYFDLSGSQACTANVMFHVVQRPVLWVRVYLVTLAGGTSPTVAARYLGVR